MESKKYGYQEIKDILEEVRICTLLCCTDGGKVYSSSAEEYIQWLEQFAKYCIPEMANEWKERIRTIIYSVIAVKPKYENDPSIKREIRNNEYVIIDSLYEYMNAAEIMEAYDKTKSWEYVNQILSEQGHTGWTLSGLSNIMIQYSLIGVDFIEKFAPNRISRDSKFKKRYKQAKEYLENRQELNKRLTYALSYKNHI